MIQATTRAFALVLLGVAAMTVWSATLPTRSRATTAAAGFTEVQVDRAAVRTGEVSDRVAEDRLQAATMAAAAGQAAVAPITQRFAAPRAAGHPAAPAASYPAGAIQDIIVAAFSPYGPAAVQWGLRVAWCESHFHAGDTPNGPYYGLFQFALSTFVNTARTAGLPYTSANIMDPVAQATVAAWKWAHGGARAWGCN